MAIVTSSKHRDHNVNKYVLAVKLSEPQIRSLAGVDVCLIQKVFFCKFASVHNLFNIKVVTEVGGVPSTPCTAFLSELEAWDPELGVVYGTNNQQAKAVLFPIVGLINSTLILQFIDCKIFYFAASRFQCIFFLFSTAT